MRLPALVLALLVAAPACAAPSYVATFHSIGLYWTPPGGAPGNAARVEFRAAGSATWRQGLDLWYDARNSEYRGSLVELDPGTTYAVRLKLDTGFTETVQAATWTEQFRIKRTVRVKPGTTHLVIEASDSGSEREGYVVFTGSRAGNVIDQSGVDGDDPRDSCIVVKQGAHHVIVRGWSSGTASGMRSSSSASSNRCSTPRRATSSSRTTRSPAGAAAATRRRGWPMTTARSTATTTASPTRQGNRAAS